ncbi:MAG: hypothetical protein KGD63_11835 [Candidatus Lokiarchaeota archaeon]|nr:hypothetical protein [Candidatus Lokiarchaeota archaeon]
MFDNDDFDDFLKNFKDYLNIDTEIFDVEFFLFSDRELNRKSKFNSKNNNGFKISYHFENGMDEPDIQIHGNIDDINLKYLKNIEFSKIKDFYNVDNNQNISYDIVDGDELSLNPDTKNSELVFQEPYIEIHDLDNFIEIILDVPGIQEDDILISNYHDKKTILFSAESRERRYHKKIRLPSKISSVLNDSMEVNNGIVTFKCKKK